MIGGRVLDRSALLAFARQTSVYAAALVWTAVEEDIVLLVPSTALGTADAVLDPSTRPVLDVLLGLPVTVVDDLGVARARDVGALGRGRDSPLEVVHAAVCALERSWPLLTATPADYTDLAEGLVVESLL